MQEHLAPPQVSNNMTDEYPKKIGRFEILELISSGGMGEIYLAFDPISKRKVALKQIKKKFFDHPSMKKRFLHEAKITSKLMHPSIIPIFEMNLDEKNPYYIMPFVEGNTLRKTLLEDRKNYKAKKETLALQTYVRTFYNICQAIFYIHSQKVLHRDLKPENIILGKFGEVVLIDWGLAQYFDTPDDPLLDLEEEGREITQPGKIIGTVTYLAPEQAKATKCNEQTDIYALGVILYQMITLKMPHKRKDIKTFKKTIDDEKILPPFKVAPYREIPLDLEMICMKCLNPDPKERYQSTKELLYDLEMHMQSRSQWQHVKSLHFEEDADWQINADIALSKYLAISKTLESIEWVNVRIASHPLVGNFKIETTLTFEEDAEGIGLLFSVPQKQDKILLENGYCLWLSTKKEKASKLFKSNIQIVEINTLQFECGIPYKLSVESMDQKIHFYMNGDLVFSYTSYLPMEGSYVGLLTKDLGFNLSQFNLYSGSLNQYVECTSIGDSFLAQGYFDLALQEYRKIATSFKGQAIADIAAFKAGITLLEKSKCNPNDLDFQQAHAEFEKLQKTPSKPLEYLGKALLYEVRQEYEEEAKCYELALRKYPMHPLLKTIKEQLHFRLQSVSSFDRITTYRFLLIVAKFLPDVFVQEDTMLLIQTLKKDWQTLPFFEKTSLDCPKDLAIALSFWLQKPLFILEVLENLNPKYDLALIENAIFSLIELDELDIAKQYIDNLDTHYQKLYSIKLLMIAILAKHDLTQALREFFDFVNMNFTTKERRVLIYLLDLAQKQKNFELINKVQTYVRAQKIATKDSKLIDMHLVQSNLLQNQFKQAQMILEKYKKHELEQENSYLFIPHLCFLFATRDQKSMQDHIDNVSKSYPLICAIQEKMTKKNLTHAQLFPYEEKLLKTFDNLFVHCKRQQER
ncbi:MAG: Serine/threonine-protein kinase PknD [Chlamydiae bacterium]|nr:Serine/threonine-protein kinase PknD [Chlamydiota bacterium]